MIDNFNCIALALVLVLSVLTPVATFAGNFDSPYRYDPGSTSHAPWQGQAHSRDQIRRDQERAREQQTEMESQRSQNQLHKWADEGARALNPNKHASGGGAENMRGKDGELESICARCDNMVSCMEIGR
jgi:hypothetical protein